MPASFGFQRPGSGITHLSHDKHLVHGADSDGGDSLLLTEHRRRDAGQRDANPAPVCGTSSYPVSIYRRFVTQIAHIVTVRHSDRQHTVTVRHSESVARFTFYRFITGSM